MNSQTSNLSFVSERRFCRRRFCASLALPLSVMLTGFSVSHVAAQSNTATGVPMFRGDATRTGAMPGPGPDPAKGIAAIWTFETEDFIHSSPVIADGVVYIGSWDGNLYAIDAVTGAKRWAYKTDGVIFSSPAVIDGVAYIGSGDNKLHAVDIASGQAKWVFETKGEVDSAPAVIDGVVYVGSDDYRLYAVDAATGQQKWEFSTKGVIHSSPAITTADKNHATGDGW